VRIRVYATPRASKSEVTGWRGDELTLRVTAPPDGGRANDAICQLFSRIVGVPKSAVRIVRGETARHKSVEIDAEEAHVRSVLGGPPAGLF
jgi:uncharacterized protein (TIGR00251 family)